MRSNSLDIKLRKTEKELKQHEQEIADQLELHELTVKELDLTKTSLKIAQEEIKQYKQKVKWRRKLVPTNITFLPSDWVGKIKSISLRCWELCYLISSNRALLSQTHITGSTLRDINFYVVLSLQLSTVTGQLSDQAAEVEELKAVVEGRKQDQKKLAAGMSEIEQLNQTIERCVGTQCMECLQYSKSCGSLDQWLNFCYFLSSYKRKPGH